MKATQFFIMSFLFVIFTLVSSVSYAQENINRVFLSGEYGSSAGIQNCPGTCSADPSGTVGIGYRFEHIPLFDSAPMTETISLEYWRSQYVINGNALEATRKEINFGWELSFDEQHRYVFSLGPGIGWMTVNGPGSLSHTAFNPSGVGKFIFQVSPSLAVTLGYTHDFIFSANQPDFIANYVTLGVRWYL